MDKTDMDRPTRQAYDELQRAYDFFNDRLFGGELPQCLITMQREGQTCGYFSPARFGSANQRVTDEIAINPQWFAVVPLLGVLQTICHEMCHQWQHHFGTPSRSSYHNKEWAAKMEDIGLMPSSTGKPGGKKTGQKMADYAIPDGPFMQATKALLDEGFILTWHDRQVPSKAHELAAYMGWDDGEDEDLDGMETDDQTEDEDTDWLAAVMKPPSPAVTAGLLEPRPNRSNRVKYRCPACGLQVWGKPSITTLFCHCVGVAQEMECFE